MNHRVARLWLALGIGLSSAWAAPADDTWKMIEPGAGGAFLAAGVGPTGIALVAADLSGGYISHDGGRSWQNRGTPHGVFGTHASLAGFDPHDESVIYLGTLGVLYRSSDRGATFQPLISDDWDAAKRQGTFRIVRDPEAVQRYRREPPKHAQLYWTAIAFSSSTPAIGYAAASSAYNSLQAILLKTTDRGNTWRPVSAPPDELRIAKIAVDPRDADTVYFLSQIDAFTGGKGELPVGPQSNIRQSVDGGRTWCVLAGDTAVTYKNVRRNVARYDADGRRSIDPATGAAAVHAGSPASPGSFTEPVLLRDVLDFEIDPVDPNILYATKGSRSARGQLPGEGTYKSTDAGAHWVKVDDKFGALKVKAVAGDASRTIIRRFDINGWEGSALPKDRKFPQTWESADAGRTWKLKADKTQFAFGAIDPAWYSPAGAYAKTITNSPAHPDVYYWVDSQWVYVSDDGGASFRSAGSNAVTKPDGEKWYASTGISNVVSLTLKVSEADPNIVFTGSSDIGLWRSLDGGGTWQHANQPGFLSDWVYYGGQAQAIALDPERPNVVWAGLGAGYVDHILVKSVAYGKLGTWQNSHRGLPQEKRKASYQAGAALRGLSVDRTSPKDNRTLYVVADDKVARSTDDGASWSEVCDLTGGQPFNYNGLTGGNISPDRQATTAVDPKDGRHVYAGGASGLFRSQQGGDPGTWEKIGPTSLDRIQKIVISPSQPELVFVAAYGSGLFRSEDRGDTWKQILADRFLRGVAVHPTDARILIAASANVWRSGGKPESSGALLSTDGGNTWRTVNEGLSWPFVRDVEFNPSDPAQVFVVTPGTSFHVRRFRF